MRRLSPRIAWAWCPGPVYISIQFADWYFSSPSGSASLEQREIVLRYPLVYVAALCGQNVHGNQAHGLVPALNEHTESF